MRRGDLVYVEGRIAYRQWQDKDEQARHSTEIHVRELLPLSGRGVDVASAAEDPAPARAA